MHLRPCRPAAACFALALLAALSLLSGCHSAFMQAVVRNNTTRPITLIEVDYPSASFGRESLAPQAEFPYRFKILGSGPTKVLWTDASRHEHNTTGPTLHEGEQGSIEISIGESAASWHVTLH